MVLLIILAVILFLLLLISYVLFLAKVRIFFRADSENGIKIKFFVSGIRVYSTGVEDDGRVDVKLSDYSPEKVRIIKARKKPKKSKSKKASSEKQKKKNKPDVMYILRFVLHFLDVLYNEFLCRFNVTVHRMTVNIASDDAAKTALLYGGVIQAVNYILAFIDQKLTLKPLKESKISIVPDYLHESTDFDIRISVDFRIRHILELVWRSGIHSPRDIMKLLGKTEIKSSDNNTKE